MPNSTPIVDGCTWTFDGYTGKLAASRATALNLTVAGASEGFVGAMDRIQAVFELVHRNPERLLVARTPADVDAAAATGRVAIVLNFQNGAPLERDVGRLDVFHAVGVRNIQLTYNERNAIGDGCLEPSDAGLSRFGRHVVAHMNELGMVVDLSHTGRRTSFEAMAASSRPCVFSHANPRTMIDNVRNIEDDQIRACADTGGVVGACAWGPILWRGGENPPGLDDLLDVVEYVAELVGIEHVGIGTDSTTSERDDHIDAHAREVNAAYPEVTAPFVARFGGTAKHRYPVPVARLPEVGRRLVERGWTATEVASVMGGNFARVWRTVWSA